MAYVEQGTLVRGSSLREIIELCRRHFPGAAVETVREDGDFVLRVRGGGEDFDSLIVHFEGERVFAAKLPLDAARLEPGPLRLDPSALPRLEPGYRPLWGRLRRVFAELPSVAELRQQLDEGEIAAALVVSCAPLLVAAYARELDSICVLRFPEAVAADRPELAVGDKLLTVNRYRERAGPQRVYAIDLIGDPKGCETWTDFTPLIADFVTRDREALEDHKRVLGDAEWGRVEELAACWRAGPDKRIRDGRPQHAGTPARIEE